MVKPGRVAALSPAETGRRYDALASAWDKDIRDSGYGVAYVRRAIQACVQRRRALDVGCGTGGRLVRELLDAGFTVTGIDVSAGMLAVAREWHPSAELLQQDVCTWTPPRSYDLIIAWDSTFHVPQPQQAGVVARLCSALEAGGVLLFTAGGIHGEIAGEMHGQQTYYSSLADHEYVRLVGEAGCRCVLAEQDQYPQRHLVILAIKT